MSLSFTDFFGLLPDVVWGEMLLATLQTLYMTFASMALVGVLGLSIGLLLFLTSPGQALANSWTYRPLALVINILRAIPFIILIIQLVPFSHWLMQSTLGPSAILPALVIGAAPFYARIVQIALKEMDRGVLEAAKAMGCNLSHLIFKILIPESAPALVAGFTVTTILMVGYTAMAGFVGGGGLGDKAYEGYLRNNGDVTFCSTLIILLIVFAVQLIGDYITRRLDKR